MQAALLVPTHLKEYPKLINKYEIHIAGQPTVTDYDPEVCPVISDHLRVSVIQTADEFYSPCPEDPLFELDTYCLDKLGVILRTNHGVREKTFIRTWPEDLGPIILAEVKVHEGRFNISDLKLHTATMHGCIPRQLIITKLTYRSGRIKFCRMDTDVLTESIRQVDPAFNID